MCESIRHRSPLVVVEGEAGIGKTRLMQEVVKAFEGLTILVAACPPLREPFPLGPLVEGVRRLRDDLEGVELSPLGGALRPLFPEWGAQLPPGLEPLGDPRETRHRLFRALKELVNQLAVDVLIAEDTHWADTATLDWLLTVCADGETGLSVVATYRPGDVTEDSQLLRLTARASTALSLARVELAPLDEAQTRQMIGSMIGTDEVSDKFAAFLHERTDGIPLAVEECIRLLQDRHDIVQRGGRWARRVLDELEVPPTVRDSVLERVARLGPDVRAVLEAAAALAAPAAEALLVAVADLDDTAGRTAMAAALRSGLLQESAPGTFVFRHVLDAQAVAHAVPASRWRWLHRRAADRLETWDPVPVVRLARHARDAGNFDVWCRYAEASADLALESGDDQTAVSVLLEVLTEVEPDLDARVRMTRKLGQAASLGVSPVDDRAERVIELLQGLIDEIQIESAVRGELRLLCGRLFGASGNVSTAFHMYEAAVPDLTHRPDLAIPAMLNLSKPVTSDWSVEVHLDWLGRASSLMHDNPGLFEATTFKISRGAILLYVGRSEGWDDLVEIDSERLEQEDLRGSARNLLNAVWAMAAWGRYDDARRYLEVAVGHLQRTDYLRYVARARVVSAHLDWYTGSWADLGDTASQLAVSTDLGPLDRLGAQHLVGMLATATGDHDRALQCLRPVAEAYSRGGFTEFEVVQVAAALGRLHLANGAAQDALDEMAPALEMVRHKELWLWATDIAPHEVDALIQSDDLDQAEGFVRDFAEGISDSEPPAPAAALLVCRGLLADAQGDIDQAAWLFETAAAAWAELPRPYDALLASERQGLALLRLGDQERGTSVLSDVQADLRRLTARWDADRVARILRNHGVEVARVWRGGRRGYGNDLSPRELEVVKLIARGLSNKEVAQTLFISPRTVDRHLGTAKRKLGVSSRAALSYTAAESGLLGSD